MSVTLRKKKNKSGTTSLYLDVYHNGKRDYEFLEIKLVKPVTPADREANRETLELAKKIAIKRSQDLIASDYDITTDNGKNTIVTTWMQAYIDKYKKKDKRNLQGALNRFKDMLKEEEREQLTFRQLDVSIVKSYIEYLKENSEGEGAASYYARFKKMVKEARVNELMQVNIFEKVGKVRFPKSRNKEVLTHEEVQQLAKTACNSEQVRRAALFSGVTGFAWIDVKELEWSMINTTHWTVRKPRQKSDEFVYINLNASAIKLLGEPGKPEDYVFDLPTANGCNKTLKAWVKRAGIQKKITWHNLRHSFGTNLSIKGTELQTIANLMGHSTVKHTQKYVKAAEQAMQRATDKLNIQL